MFSRHLIVHFTLLSFEADPCIFLNMRSQTSCSTLGEKLPTARKTDRVCVYLACSIHANIVVWFIYLGFIQG